MKSYHYAEVYPSKDGWRFRVKGNNNEIMCVGEAYVRRIDAESALKELFGNGMSMEVVVRNHGKEVVDHYTIRRGPLPEPPEPESLDLGPVYIGPMDDTTARYLPPGVDPNEPYPHPEDDDEPSAEQ